MSSNNNCRQQFDSSNLLTLLVFVFSFLAVSICFCVNSLNVVGVYLLTLTVGLYISFLYLYPTSPREFDQISRKQRSKPDDVFSLPIYFPPCSLYVLTSKPDL